MKYQPEAYGTVTASLIVNGAHDLIAFIEKAVGGTERMRMPMPDGRIGHAEVTVGDSVIMVSDAADMFPATPGALHVWVPDADRTYRKALDAGASSVSEPEDQFYGARSANVRDRWGNLWTFATHKEDVSMEEIEKRLEAMA